MAIKLISFKLCPFAQRVIITLLEKNISYNVIYIEPEQKPAWFINMSPTGKVPVMQVDDAVLFESAVINEYLNEKYLPNMHPVDLIQKTKNRAWIEYSSKLLMEEYALINSNNQAEFNDNLAILQESFKTLETHIMHKPFFNGKDFALIDAAFAPVFVRAKLIQDIANIAIYPEMSRATVWSRNLLSRTSVKQSIVPEFNDLFMEYLQKNDSYILKNSK